MNVLKLLQLLKDGGELKTVFRFPYVHVIVLSEEYQNQDEEVREQALIEKLHVSSIDLRVTLQTSLLSLKLLTPQEFYSLYPNEYESRDHHWLSAIIEQELNLCLREDKNPAQPIVVHFYGYKGGQSRSTLLGLLSTTLAEDGWRVLSVDADIEAPSLDILYSRGIRSISSTLLAFNERAVNLQPEPVRTSDSTGLVDLLACRPKSGSYEIEASAFALRTMLDPSLVVTCAKEIQKYANAKKYDIILIDHRAGLAPATLTWMNTLRGPTVICARLDEQWRPASKYIQTILGTNPSNPGLFVSFKPDSENDDIYRERNLIQTEDLLDILADTLAKSIEPEGAEEISSKEIQDHWIIWHYDSVFRQSRLPKIDSLSNQNLSALTSIRSLLGILSKRNVQERLLSPSGALDTGDLIQTDALQQLRLPNSPFTYVFGRKGTGKTRLLRELAVAKVGEPLIVDSQSAEDSGLKSPSPELSAAIEKYKQSPETLWWTLIAAALTIPNTNSENLRKAFVVELEKNASLENIIKLVFRRVQNAPRRHFLIDGLETAFRATNVFPFTESLFKFLRTFESDSILAQAVWFKLFLRTDLAERGYQNIEQQIADKVVYLNWDTQKIFNFVLSRIVRLAWYRTAFPELIKEIENRLPTILKGNLETAECESLLLMAFPSRLSRSNIAMTTFLRTYFADSASDKPDISSSDKLRYYPRIFNKFLEVIGDPKPDDVGSFRGSQLNEHQKINEKLIFVAHEAAAREYLGQLQSELIYLINFNDDQIVNEEKIQALLNAFSGLQTPFWLEEIITELHGKTGIEKQQLRQAMDRMTSVGMFENHPKYAGALRVGRLFKSSLQMKYVRGFSRFPAG